MLVDNSIILTQFNLMIIHLQTKLSKEGLTRDWFRHDFFPSPVSASFGTYLWSFRWTWPTIRRHNPAKQNTYYSKVALVNINLIFHFVFNTSKLNNEYVHMWRLDLSPSPFIPHAPCTCSDAFPISMISCSDRFIIVDFSTGGVVSGVNL